jgi:hypothetical protein
MPTSSDCDRALKLKTPNQALKEANTLLSAPKSCKPFIRNDIQVAYELCPLRYN